MSVLTKQFKDALSMIEPKGDAENAARAHADVRQVLDADETLAEWGLDTVLIGSYKRAVSIRRVKDVDVFCQLPDLPDDYDPQALLEDFARALTSSYGGRVSKNDRSVKVEFPAYDMHVDVVPARRASPDWEIPDKNGGWERTHPVKFGALTTDMNQAHDGNYVPIVKLVRQTRRALLGSAKPGGLFVEVAAYHAFVGLPDASSAQAPTSTAEYYTAALEAMARILRDHAAGTAPLMNPALGNEELHVRATQSELDDIALVWEDAASRARVALDSDDEHEAAKIFHALLGQNSDEEEVFTVPVRSSSTLTSGRRELPTKDTVQFA